MAQCIICSRNAYRFFLRFQCWLLETDTCLFFRYQRFIESTDMVCRKNTNKIFIYIDVVEILNSRFYLKIWYSFRHFASWRATPALFLQRNFPGPTSSFCCCLRCFYLPRSIVINDAACHFYCFDIFLSLLSVISIAFDNVYLPFQYRGRFTRGGAGGHAPTPFFCNHFEELQTVLTEVKLIINNAPWT